MNSEGSIVSILLIVSTIIYEELNIWIGGLNEMNILI